jgi:hypothetical protein
MLDADEQLFARHLHFGDEPQKVIFITPDQARRLMDGDTPSRSGRSSPWRWRPTSLASWSRASTGPGA